MPTNLDLTFLHQALQLAKIRRGFCVPNPSVGAVVVNQQGNLIATGYHSGSGTCHAEIVALQNSGVKTRDATIYVTLEPCCHWGKTPPCTDALIRAGVHRVVYGCHDPNPEVNGKGIMALKAAGIVCEHIPLQEIDIFYASYHHWQQTKKPFITAKIALSLNGAIARKSGERLQITGEVLGDFTHFSRKTSDAILTTAKTIIYDNPQLNARYQSQIIAKPIYILDSKLKLPKTATIFNTAESLTVFHSINANAGVRDQLLDLGVRCIPINMIEEGLDLNQIVNLIGQDGIHDLWIEAGGKCFAAFVAQKLLQQAFIYIAPHWLLDGKIAFPEGICLDLELTKVRWQQFGNDVLCQIHW